MRAELISKTWNSGVLILYLEKPVNYGLSNDSFDIATVKKTFENH